MKIGVMNNPTKPVYEEAVACGEAGFDFLDMTVEGPEAAVVDVEKLRNILTRYDLAVTGHTDPCIPHAYPIQSVRDACLAELERCAGIFSALGAKVMNIHPCYFCPPAMRRDIVAFNIESMQAVAAMAAGHGLSLVVENYKAPFDRVATFAKMLQAVPGLQLHLDFGHTNFGHDSFTTFCAELGEHIRHVHFSDNRSKADDHMPLGVGTINWREAVQALRSIGYDQTITLEIFCHDADMQKTYLEASRRLVRSFWEAS